MGIDDEIARGEIGLRILDLKAIRERAVPTSEGVHLSEEDFEALITEVERLRKSASRMTALLGVP